MDNSNYTYESSLDLVQAVTLLNFIYRFNKGVGTINNTTFLKVLFPNSLYVFSCDNFALEDLCKLNDGSTKIIEILSCDFPILHRFSVEKRSIFEYLLSLELLPSDCHDNNSLNKKFITSIKSLWESKYLNYKTIPFEKGIMEPVDTIEYELWNYIGINGIILRERFISKPPDSLIIRRTVTAVCLRRILKSKNGASVCPAIKCFRAYSNYGCVDEYTILDVVLLLKNLETLVLNDIHEYIDVSLNNMKNLKVITLNNVSIKSIDIRHLRGLKTVRISSVNLRDYIKVKRNVLAMHEDKTYYIVINEDFY